MICFLPLMNVDIPSFLCNRYSRGPIMDITSKRVISRLVCERIEYLYYLLMENISIITKK